MNQILVSGLLLLFVYGCVAPPVTEQKKKKHDKGSAEDNEIEEQVCILLQNDSMSQVISHLLPLVFSSVFMF